jgi:hypothetical protein
MFLQLYKSTASSIKPRPVPDQWPSWTKKLHIKGPERSIESISLQRKE